MNTCCKKECCEKCYDKVIGISLCRNPFCSCHATPNEGERGKEKEHIWDNDLCCHECGQSKAHAFTHPAERLCKGRPIPSIPTSKQEKPIVNQSKNDCKVIVNKEEKPEWRKEEDFYEFLRGVYYVSQRCNMIGFIPKDCPHKDCPKVRYHECPIHGRDAEKIYKEKLTSLLLSEKKRWGEEVRKAIAESENLSLPAEGKTSCGEGADFWRGHNCAIRDTLHLDILSQENN